MSYRQAIGPLQAPMSQWMLLLGGFCFFSNPEKFTQALQSGVKALLMDAPAVAGNQQAPIVIHHGASNNGNKSLSATMIQYAMGAGVCWGTYVILVTVLPEAAKGLLPVTTSVFNKAITSLGKGLISVKDSLTKQLMDLSKKQDDTHGDVLEIKDQVGDISGNVESVQESLASCQVALDENERRTHYIARGVRLLSRGVSTILPHDADLVYELEQFQKAGMDLVARGEQDVTPRSQQAPSRRRVPPPQTTPVAYPVTPLDSTNSSKMQQQQQRIQVQQIDHPTNETPGGGLADVHALLATVGGGKATY